MKIISERKYVATHEYRHEFSTDRVGSFYSFPCTETGECIVGEDNPQRIENLAQAFAGEIYGRKVKYIGIQKYTNNYTQPAIGECECCNREVMLEVFTNTCECGADYNMSGQRLASRSQWGEETGEPWYECM